VRTTSLAEATGAEGVGGPALPCFRKRLAWRFAQEYGMRQRIVSRERALAGLLAPA
jgi:hypothetical protein